MTVWTNFRTGAFVIAMIWLASEILLAVIARSKGGAVKKADKYSMGLIWLTIAPCIFAGKALGTGRAGFIAAGSLAISFAGLVLMIAGQGIRWIAIATLGRFFTPDVSIQKGHAIVEKGLYKFIRHPSYTGSLLTFLGFGLTFSNWLSALVLFVPMTAVFLYRIHVEEQALTEFFGDAYLQYRRTTKRLFPGIY
jgi:protein-S-isoprenylcysteine O-methyltransferase Ste14